MVRTRSKVDMDHLHKQLKTKYQFDRKALSTPKADQAYRMIADRKTPCGIFNGYNHFKITIPGDDSFFLTQIHQHVKWRIERLMGCNAKDENRINAERQFRRNRKMRGRQNRCPFDNEMARLVGFEPTALRFVV